MSKESSQAPFSEDSFVVSQIITSTQLTGDAATAADNLTFGSYAVSFNTEVTNALAYSVVPMHSEVNTVEAVVSGSSLLTTDWMLL